jgi:hypothetical protein
MMEARLLDPEQPVVARRESRLMHSVNTNLRERTEASPGSDPIAFFCECGDATCYLPMWMAVEAFDAMVAAETGWLLLDGHEPSGLWHRREPLPTRVSPRSRALGQINALRPTGKRRGVSFRRPLTKGL